MSRACIYLSDDERKLLDFIAEKLDRTPSWVVRYMLQNFANQMVQGYKARLPDVVDE